MITVCSINACLLLWGEGESCWCNVLVRITFSDESDAQFEDSGRAAGAFRLIRHVPVGWLLAHTTHCLYQSPRTIGSLTELWGKKMIQHCRGGSFRFVDRSCGVVRLLWLPPTEGLRVFVRTRQVESRASAYNICSSRLLSVLCCLQLHLLRSVNAVVLHKQNQYGMKIHTVFLMHVIDLIGNNSSMHMFRPNFLQFYLKCHNLIFQWNYSLLFSYCM